ncbi:MAG: hypothetical protein WCL06_05030 [Bacteroidota bacterium]
MYRNDKEGKLMLLNVYSVLKKPANNYATLRPGLTEPMGLLNDQIIAIILAETKAASPIFGDTVDKENKFDQMMYSIFHITSAASAYYSMPATADPGLKAKVNFTISKLLNIPYADAEANTKAIIDVITPIIDDLEPFGAKQIHLDDAIAKRKEFLDVQTKPRINIDERKVQNANIHPNVLEGKRICEEMIDPIIRTLFTDHHDLYALYFNARQIINLPHGTTVVEGYVFKSDGVTPVYDAIIKFPQQNLQTNTLIDGSFRLIKFPHGLTTPEIIYGGTQITTEPFEVKQGQTVKRIFKLPG